MLTAAVPKEEEEEEEEEEEALTVVYTRRQGETWHFGEGARSQDQVFSNI